MKFAPQNGGKEKVYLGTATLVAHIGATKYAILTAAHNLEMYELDEKLKLTGAVFIL